MNEVYINYGLYVDGWRVWDHARDYGFLCAGGGPQYSGGLHTIRPSERLWVYIPEHGYVGVARATGPVQRAGQFTVATPHGPAPIMQVLGGPYANDTLYLNDPDRCEYFLPIRWLDRVETLDCAVRGDVFASPNVVCRPSAPFWCQTLERLMTAFPNHDLA